MCEKNKIATKMTICKYFLQGTCRFGDSCKFEHQVSDHNYANSTSVLHQNYANKLAQTTTSNVDTNTLVKSVVNDMTSAEKGGQWLLSSYAPFKEKPAFPGFEDHSMEEIRYLFYESLKNGTVEQFKQNLQMMLQQAVMKIQSLQNPSPDAINMLKRIYNTPPSSSVTNISQTQFTATTNSAYGNSQQQKAAFGGAASNQNPFGSLSIFGNGTQQQQVFGGSQKTDNIFGGQQQPSMTKSIFGNHPQQATNSNSIFGGGNSVFGVGTQSVFGSHNRPQSTLFNQQPSSSPFVQPQQQNLFQQSPSNQFGCLNTQFGVPQNSGSQIGGAQNSTATSSGIKPSFQHTANIFGNVGMQNTATSVFGQNSTHIQHKPNEDFYSKIEELNKEEIKWFQSDDLDINKIPEKPPTYEMCFKV